MRVPVVSREGKPLMPTTPARCRKMIESGVARKQWSKEGVFYVQMLIPVGEEIQEMALAIDPGSKYDGYAVSGTREVVLQGMAVLPSRVKKRMEVRKHQRRARRHRNLRRRPARFDNRKRKGGWIAPSQLAKVQLRIRIMQRLCQILPVTDILIEDVRFNHYEKRWGRHFSTVEIGKTKVYEAARGGNRRRQGGTTHSNSDLRKGDVIWCVGQGVGHVGGWRRSGRSVSLINSYGKRIWRVANNRTRLLARSPNVLTEKRKCHFAFQGRK